MINHRHRDKLAAVEAFNQLRECGWHAELAAKALGVPLETMKKWRKRRFILRRNKA